MLWVCEDGLCGHWYVLGLIATNTWCKPGHCSSVAVNPLSGVKSEPTAGYLANPPFWTISIFSSPKGGLRWRKTIDCIVLRMFHCSWSSSHWFPDIASETSCVMTAKFSPIINQICQSWRLFSHGLICDHIMDFIPKMLLKYRSPYSNRDGSVHLKFTKLSRGYLRVINGQCYLLSH